MTTTPTTKRRATSRIVDRAILDTLRALSGGTGTATAKAATLADSAGVHPCTVYRALRRLRADGKIDFGTRRGVLTTYTLSGLFVPHA